MATFVSFNNKLLSNNEVSVSALSAAAVYGKGVFTTIAIHDGTPFLWKKHWRRLTTNAQKLEIDLAKFPEAAAKAALAELIKKNSVVNGRARITFFDELPAKIWPSETGRKTSLLIMTGDLRPIPENFRLTISPYPVNSRSPLAGVKSCNYLEDVMAMDDAKGRGFHEAIRVNERGEVTSATMANVFWLKGSRLYTPSLGTGCLAGTTREFVLESLACSEVETTIDDLNTADAIFLTSAGLGVVQVAEFVFRKFDAIEHPIVDLLPHQG